MTDHDLADRRLALALDRELLDAADAITGPLEHTAPSPARDSAVASMAFAAARRLGCDDYGVTLFRECLARLRNGEG